MKKIIKYAPKMPMLWFRSLVTVENRVLHLFNRIVIQFLKKRGNARKTKKTRGNLGFSWVHLFWHRFLAAEEGFEPSQTESESAVLPLHNSAIFSCFGCLS